MPFASRGYPHVPGGEDDFAFPGDFVAEYVAQTRGWFYTMFVLATALFDAPPFTSAVCHGVVLAEDGRYRAAMDPRAYGAVGPSIAGLLRLAAAPLRLAAGERDPMVTLEQMRRIDPAAEVFPGVGHNAHWEAPDQVWRFIAGAAP